MVRHPCAARRPASLLLLVLPALLPAQTLTRGPSVWEHGSTSFLVAFQSSSAATGRVEWGPTEALGNATTGNATTDHAIRITGLLPDHFYWYRVQLDGMAVTPVFRTRTFAAQGSDVSFFVFGDCGVGTPDQMRVASLYQGWNWDLGLMPGDIVYPGGEAANFDPHFFAPYGPALRGTPHYPVLGNHDAATQTGQPFLDAFYLPTANSGTERWYSFDFGNCHFIGLDSTRASSPQQRAWLRNDLMAARANGAAWIFATLHHAAYASGEHGRTAHVFNNWCPLFEEFEVDAVFQGHDHIYERSAVVRDFHPNNRGVVYFVVGTGGADLDSIDPQPYSAYARAAWGALKVDVRGNVFRSVFLDGDPGSAGQQHDAFTMVRGPVTPALRATDADPQIGQVFTGAFDAPSGSFHALFAALQPGYASVPGLGLFHLGTPNALLASGVVGPSQRAAFSLAVPNHPAFTGLGLFFQGVAVSGGSTSLTLTDLLHGRVR
ncbi:MAG TPA: metallophosphoesterase [Planctomycetota bacterium]